MRERDAFGASAPELLNEQLAMRASSGEVMPSEGPSKDMSGQINPADGYEWLEHPEGSGFTTGGPRRVTTGPSGEVEPPHDVE